MRYKYYTIRKLNKLSRPIKILVIIKIWFHIIYNITSLPKINIDPHSQKEHTKIHKIPNFGVKVAEHSFQVPIPNLPLLLNYLCFGAHFLHESRLIIEVFILAFWLGCVLLPWQWGL